MRYRLFERFLGAAHRELVRRYGPALADGVRDATRLEYERVRPEVPDIGGVRNVFQPVMTVNGWLVALHRAMLAHGRSAEDTIRVSQAVIDGWLQAVPSVVLRAMGRLLLTAPVRRYFERQARRSRERRYAADFVWQVETRSDGETSLVFDECAVNKWYDAQDVRELKPYCNFVDVTYSRLMGMGVDATQTIGLGCERCALRYKHGRATPIPPTLQGIVSERSG